MLPVSTALLLLDVQMAWDEPYWGGRNNPEAEARIAELLETWRSRGLPVVHVRHDARDPNSPLFPAEPGHAYKPEGMPHPGETEFRKSAHCAFVGTGLEAHLRGLGVDRLVIAGFSTPHGVSSTARLACDLGFKTVVIRDACAAFELEDVDGTPIPPQTLHDVSLAALHGEFAMVLPAKALLEIL
jgi:nicotinamidase-related amidase